MKIDIILNMRLLVAMIPLLPMAAFVTKLVALVFDCYAEIAKGVV